jgi:hypothetical protein
MPIRTTVSRMRPQRPSAFAITGQVAKYSPAVINTGIVTDPLQQRASGIRWWSVGAVLRGRADVLGGGPGGEDAQALFVG